jgi:hypothetical protein
MKQLVVVVIALLLFISCSKENEHKQICNLADPIYELPWLKEIKNSLTDCQWQTAIIQANYDGQTVFYTASNDPLANSNQSYTLYNCDGKIIEVTAPEKFQDFTAKITDVKILYQCKN